MVLIKKKGIRNEEKYYLEQQHRFAKLQRNI